jgi:hypothetical protein
MSQAVLVAVTSELQRRHALSRAVLFLATIVFLAGGWLVGTFAVPASILLFACGAWMAAKSTFARHGDVR